jgi:hypothetical protein
VRIIDSDWRHEDLAYANEHLKNSVGLSTAAVDTCAEEELGFETMFR